MCFISGSYSTIARCTSSSDFLIPSDDILTDTNAFGGIVSPPRDFFAGFRLASANFSITLSPSSPYFVVSSLVGPVLAIDWVKIIELSSIASCETSSCVRVSPVVIETRSLEQVTSCGFWLIAGEGSLMRSCEVNSRSCGEDTSLVGSCEVNSRSCGEDLSLAGSCKVESSDLPLVVRENMILFVIGVGEVEDICRASVQVEGAGQEAEVVAKETTVAEGVHDSAIL